MQLSVQELLLKAQQHAKNGQIAQAKQLYQSILTKFPQNKLALQGLATLSGPKKAIGAAPGQDQVNAVIALYNQGRLKEAIEKLEVLVEKFPQAELLHNISGAVYFGLDRLDDAISSFNRALQINPKSSKALNNLGNALKEQGDLNSAIKHYHKALQMDPNYADAHSNLGIALKEKGDLKSAITSYNQALLISPDNADLHNALGNILKEQGDIAAAIKSYNQAIAMKPKFAGAYNNLGVVLKQNGDFSTARECYRKALQIEPNNADLHHNLGNVLKETDEFTSAIECYNRALEIDPGYTGSFADLCELYEKTNDISALAKILAESKNTTLSDNANFLYYSAKLDSREKKYDSAKAKLNQVNPENLSDKRTLSFYELQGKNFDKLGEFDNAFVAFSSMNKKTTEGGEFSLQKPDEYLNEISSYLNVVKEAKSFSPTAGNEITSDTDSPCFLVGFPRSGTTLLDTILRSHTKIDVIEEQPMVANVRKTLGGHLAPEQLENLDPENVSILRSKYFEELYKHIDNVHSQNISIDKLPLNALNAPLIRTIFPNSKFILAIRHPFDSILSCFMQNFKLNPPMANMVDMDRIVEFYCITMETWWLSQQRYNSNYHIIRYEDLVVDMPAEIGNLLQFLDLEWETTLTDYQKTAMLRERINTPSYSQVIQPLYKDASYRWKNYQKYLCTYEKQIRPWIERFGY